MITYTWHGFGLTLEWPDGRTVWLQGDDASDLLDELESCETDRQQQAIMSDYSDFAE